MTCIAWDGETLAADKRAISVGLSRTTTKIFKVNDHLIGLSADSMYGLDLITWFRNGCAPAEFPATQRDDKYWATLVAIQRIRRKAVIQVYERSPTPMIFEDRFWATGSGRDYAMAAMHLGKSATQAVELACVYDVNCGNGIDCLRFDSYEQL